MRRAVVQSASAAGVSANGERRHGAAGEGA